MLLFAAADAAESARARAEERWRRRASSACASLRGHLDLQRGVRAAGASSKINDVLVEAGPRLSGALLAAGLVDEWLLYLAPKLLGKEAKPLAALARLTKLAAAPQFELLESTAVGPDLRLRLQPRAQAGKLMFTGLVQEVGEIIRRSEARAAAPARADRRIEVGFARIARERSTLGASICVDGVCLTVAALDADSFRRRCLGRNPARHHARRQARRRARESRAGAARRRQPRRALGVGPRRRRRRSRCTRARRALAARRARGAGSRWRVTSRARVR